MLPYARSRPTGPQAASGAGAALEQAAAAADAAASTQQLLQQQCQQMHGQLYEAQQEIARLMQQVGLLDVAIAVLCWLGRAVAF